MGLQFLNHHFLVPCNFAVSFLSVIDHIQYNAAIWIYKTDIIKQRPTACTIDTVRSGKYKFTKMRQIIIQAGISYFFGIPVNNNYRVLFIAISIHARVK